MLSLCAIFALLYGAPVQQLSVEVTNIGTAKGTIRAALYNNASDFSNWSNPVAYKTVPLTGTGTVRLQVPIPQSGKYALAIYHDLNNNNQLDVNALGIPKEPYAFSKTPESKWKAPTFDDVAFSTQQVPAAGLKLALKTWTQY